MTDLVGINEGANIMGVSIEGARKYKGQGFFKPVKAVGKKHFFNKKDFERLALWLPLVPHKYSLDGIKRLIDSGAEPEVCSHCGRAY